MVMAGAIAKYHCNYCEEDITNIRVKCSECLDFDLCLQCFSCGAEIGSHKNKHSYQLIDCGTFPIYNSCDRWRALDEVALLEAIEQYGFGNWNDIADSVGIKDLSADDAKEHYTKFYILGNIGRALWANIDNNSLAMKDHTCPNDCPLSPSLTTPLPAITEVSQKDQDALGYLPKRDDFEREYDNEAESLISTITMTGNDDDELEAALKLSHISMYQRRLMQRFRKKHIAREYGLVYQFFKSHNTQKDQNQTTLNKINTNNLKKKHSNSQTQNNEFNCLFDDKFKPLLRFETFEESRELMQNLQREKELKANIKELLRFRKNGLKRLNECSAFELARNKREKRKENKKKSVSNSITGFAHKRSLSTVKKESVDQAKEEINANFSHIGRKGAGKESFDISKKSDTNEHFDVLTLPASRLLSEREKKLCSNIRLRPTQYITLKTIILKEYSQKRKSLSISKPSLENIDKTLRRKIVNFMVKCGWISSY